MTRSDPSFRRRSPDSAFDTAFAKLLWLIVMNISVFFLSSGFSSSNSADYLKKVSEMTDMVL